MEPKDFYRQNVAFMKYMYDLTMNTWSAMFEYGEKMMEYMAGQGGSTNGEQRKFMREWLENGRRAREEFRRTMDDGFDRLRDLYE